MKAIILRYNMKRKLYFSLCLVISTLLATACSSGGDITSSGSIDQKSESEWIGSATNTDYGKVVISEKPKTIVALQPYIADILLSIGYEPSAVQISGSIDDVPWLEDRLPDATIHGDLAQNDGTPDLEKISALEPDLIIGTINNATNKEQWERLNEIAPTLVPNKSIDGDWEARFKLIASSLNEEETANERILDIKNHFTDSGRKLNLTGKTYSYLLTRTDNGFTTQPGGVFRLLGMVPSGVQGDDNKSDRYSGEQWSLVDGNVIFVSNKGKLDYRENISRSSTTGRSEHNMIELTANQEVALNNKSPLSLLWLANDILTAENTSELRK